MAADDALHDGKPDAGAFEIAFRVEPLEDVEELIVIFHAESDAVVLHVKNVFPIADLPSDFDYSFFPLSRELNGIGKKIREDLPDKTLISHSLGEIACYQGSYNFGVRFLFLLPDRLHQFVHINFLKL